MSQNPTDRSPTGPWGSWGPNTNKFERVWVAQGLGEVLKRTSLNRSGGGCRAWGRSSREQVWTGLGGAQGLGEVLKRTCLNRSGGAGLGRGPQGNKFEQVWGHRDWVRSSREQVWTGLGAQGLGEVLKGTSLNRSYHIGTPVWRGLKQFVFVFAFLCVNGPSLG